MNYNGPTTEAETDWKAWLFNRPTRPFDAKMHAMWMGYSEITSGTIGGWMSHFVNLVHYVTGCGLPKSASHGADDTPRQTILTAPARPDRRHP